MKKKFLCLFLALCFCIFPFSVVSVCAEESDYLLLEGRLGETVERHTVTHVSFTLPTASFYPSYATGGFKMVDMDINAEISVFAPDFTDRMTPVAFYPMNFVGADDCSDEQNIDCINSLIDHGFIVAVVDFMDDPRACSPNIDWVIQGIRNNTSTYLSSFEVEVDYRGLDNYVIPEGYGITRGVVYYDYETNAPEGLLEDITNTYNNPNSSFRTTKGNLIPEPYKSVGASNVYECVNKDTSPVVLELYLDIIYPKYRENAPVVLNASASNDSMGIVRNMPLDVTAGIRGYVTVIYDHQYIPMCRDDHYGICNVYSYNHCLGNQAHAAASRCVKYYADTYGYSKDKYVSLGISKMAMTGVLTHPELEKVSERKTISNQNAGDLYGELPYLAYRDGTPIDSTVEISYHAEGDGSRYASTWLTEGCKPAILGCGLYDEYDSWAYWDQLQELYEEKGVTYYPFSMYNLGHDYPYGICNFYGYDRWETFFDIISYYLEDDMEARIAFSSIYNGEIVGDVKVSNRIIQSNNRYVSSTQTKGNEIFVQFIAPVTEGSVIEAISLVDENGNEVEGSFRGKCGGLKWYFEPKQALESGSYTLKVKDNTVKSVKNNLITSEGGEWSFSIK